MHHAAGCGYFRIRATALLHRFHCCCKPTSLHCQGRLSDATQRRWSQHSLEATCLLLVFLPLLAMLRTPLLPCFSFSAPFSSLKVLP